MEGTTEVLCFQELLRKLNKDQKFVIMQLGGSSLINEKVAPQLSELARITDSKRIHVYIDSERETPDAPLDTERQGFIRICSELGFNARASDRKATENYFPQTAITRALGRGYQALTPYQRLKEAARPWRKADNYKIAREMQFEDIQETDLGRFLCSI